MRIKPVKFPKDELPHKSNVEWWYFNGHLKDSKGNEYAFMDCLFNVDVKKVNIPFLKHSPIRRLYFSHSLLSDYKAKKNYPQVGYVSFVSRDSFKKPLLYINYIDPFEPGILEGYNNKIIEETKKFSYHIQTDNINLNMTSVKKPLLEDGKGYVQIGRKGTYYYSLTNLKTEGTITVNGKKINVKGKSWMDHQWANVKYSKDKWTWFSIQLKNDTEIVCFNYDDGKNKRNLATISYPNNHQVSTDEVIITPKGKLWESKETKAKYPLLWKIEIPSQDISLEAKTLIKKQEMLFGTINYWEGPTRINGTVKGEKVEGKGFLELVGRPMGISNFKIYRKETMKMMKESVSYAMKSERTMMHNIMLSGKRKIRNIFHKH